MSLEQTWDGLVLVVDSICWWEISDRSQPLRLKPLARWKSSPGWGVQGTPVRRESTTKSPTGIALLAVWEWGCIWLLHMVWALGEPQGEARGSGAAASPELLARFRTVHLPACSWQVLLLEGDHCTVCFVNKIGYQENICLCVISSLLNRTGTPTSPDQPRNMFQLLFFCRTNWHRLTPKLRSIWNLGVSKIFLSSEARSTHKSFILIVTQGNLDANSRSYENI